MGKKNHEKGTGSTPATVQLDKAGVTFTTYEYVHSNDHMDDGYGVEASTKLGFDEHQVFKTLMADTGTERVVGVVRLWDSARATGPCWTKAPCGMTRFCCPEASEGSPSASTRMISSRYWTP